MKKSFKVTVWTYTKKIVTDIQIIGVICEKREKYTIDWMYLKKLSCNIQNETIFGCYKIIFLHTSNLKKKTKEIWENN